MSFIDRYLQSQQAIPAAVPEFSVGAPQTFNYTGATLEEQIANQLMSDLGRQSGPAWEAMGQQGVVSEFANSLRNRGVTDLSQVRYVDSGDGNYVVNYGAAPPPKQGATRFDEILNFSNPVLGTIRTGKDRTNLASYRKDDGSIGFLTNAQMNQDVQDALTALAVVGGGFLGGQALGAATAGGAGAAGTAGAAAEGAAAAGGAGTAAGGAGTAAAGAADLGMAGFGQIGIPSAIPSGAGFGTLGTAGLPAVSTYGGAAIGGGLAGSLGAATAGAAGGGGGGVGAAEAAQGFGEIGMPSSIPQGAGYNIASQSGLPAVSTYGGSPIGAGTLASAGAAGAGGIGGGGTPPPANPYNPASYLNPTNLANVATSGGLSGLLGPAATVAGALGGAQGQQQSQSTTRELPAFLQGPVGDLTTRAQGLLGAQQPQAQAAGQQMMMAGQGLLSAPIAGNGVGQITLQNPTTAQNPYLSSLADDMQRRTQELLAQNNLDIQGQFAGGPGLGGSRQGIAQGVAAGKAADYLSGNLASLYGNAWNSDANRALQKYGQDQGFYTSQRGQDLTGAGIGGGLLSDGLNAQWSPMLNASRTFSPFTGFGNTTNSSESGGGWQGALGGALSGAAMGRQMGWW